MMSFHASISVLQLQLGAIAIAASRVRSARGIAGPAAPRWPSFRRAAALAPGLVLRSINGAAVVGACRPRDALAISKQIRGSPRPLTLEFVEGA